MLHFKTESSKISTPSPYRFSVCWLHRQRHWVCWCEVSYAKHTLLLEIDIKLLQSINIADCLIPLHYFDAIFKSPNASNSTFSGADPTGGLQRSPDPSAGGEEFAHPTQEPLLVLWSSHLAYPQFIPWRRLWLTFDHFLCLRGFLANFDDILYSSSYYYHGIIMCCVFMCLLRLLFIAYCMQFTQILYILQFYKIIV